MATTTGWYGPAMTKAQSLWRQALAKANELDKANALAEASASQSQTTQNSEQPELFLFADGKVRRGKTAK